MTPVPIDDIRYYFDGIQRDRLDAGSHAHRSARILDVRDRLMRLGDVDFNRTIETIDRLVKACEPQPEKDRDGKQDPAHQLFQATAGGSGGPSERVSAGLEFL